MFGVWQVDIADMVDDLAVDFFRDVLIKAAVAGFHVEDRDLQPLGRDRGEGAVGVTQKEAQHLAFLQPALRRTWQ